MRKKMREGQKDMERKKKNKSDLKEMRMRNEEIKE